MFRKLMIGLTITAAVVCGFVLVWKDTRAQSAKIGITAKQDQAVAPPNGTESKALRVANTLPIRQVVLFNSGVGYFQRAGQVEGDARVDLQMRAGDINDLIKSLVLEDASGRAMPLRYDSQEPIEKTLKSFGIDLSYNPSFGQILNQARGEKVELTLQNNNTGLPGSLTGTIIGMESAQRPTTPTATTTTEMEFLNLLCPEGIRTIPLTQIQRLRFLNPTLETELRRALEVVAGGHDALKKSVRLEFKGAGKRQVKVGYVAENPIWKTSYRLVLNANGKTKLLGWANVENTSDEDWSDVKLTLVSGRPISFQMDLYPPLYIPRPTVEPELFASLRPPAYQGPLTNIINLNQFGIQGGAGPTNGVVINPGLNQGMMGVGGFAGGIGGNFNNSIGQFGNLGGQLGNQGGQMGNRYQNPMLQNLNNDQARLNYQEFQSRRNSKADPNAPAQQKQMAAEMGSIIANLDPNPVEAALSAEELGNPARYEVEQSLSLPRQQSAMIPILDQSIESERVSIYNERVQAKHPLLGLKIKNTSKSSLMSGPITLYDGEQYLGDARILDLQPGEDRFVSYAIDTSVEVKPFDRAQPAPEMTVSVQNGQLNVQYRLRQTRSYVIKNRSLDHRKIVIEQPIRDGWIFAEARKVVSEKEAWKPGDLEKPTERTRDLYRFVVAVKPGETIKYEVSEELPRVDPFAITKQTDWSGFATSLGLDVWTESTRTPEDTLNVKITNNNLQVSHLDRRTTKYFLRSRVNEERTIWLELNLPNERRLLGDEKPIAEDAKRYRIKLALPANKTIAYSVTDEWLAPKAETFALQKIDGAPIPRPGSNDPPQTRYVTELGFEMWIATEKNPTILEKIRFVKGDVDIQSKEVESLVYHIRNRSTQERKFVLEHTVRPEWSIVGNPKRLEGAGFRYEFALTAGINQVSRQEIREEHRLSKRSKLDSISADQLKEYLASPNASNKVKETLRKGSDLIQLLASTNQKSEELTAQLKGIMDEQMRLKTNMEKLPVDSPLYKRFVEKLDKSETDLEQAQKELNLIGGSLKSQKEELSKFFTDLNVE